MPGPHSDCGCAGGGSVPDSLDGLPAVPSNGSVLIIHTVLAPKIGAFIPLPNRVGNPIRWCRIRQTEFAIFAVFAAFPSDCGVTAYKKGRGKIMTLPINGSVRSFRALSIVIAAYLFSLQCLACATFLCSHSRFPVKMGATGGHNNPLSLCSAPRMIRPKNDPP